MSTPYSQNDYLPYSDPFAALAETSERSAFLMKTYLNLAGAILALVVLEFLYFALGLQQLGLSLMANGPITWLVVLGLFMFVSYIANSWALNATDIKMQYAGLGLYVVAQSVLIFALLCVVFHVLGALAPQVIGMAGGATLGLFGLMTGVVFFTRKDFSFLRSILAFGSIAALGFIVVSMVLGLNTLGPIFAYAMIALACGYILYDTSNVMHHYRTSQHAAAALALFASVVLLFWYILRLLLILYSSRD